MRLAGPLVTLAVAAGLTACGLSLDAATDEADAGADPTGVGVATPDEAEQDAAGARDAGARDADEGDANDGDAEGCDPTSCGLAPAAGFSLVLYGKRVKACPAGFEAANVVENPNAKPAACACSCVPDVNCSNGRIESHYDNTGNGACGTEGLPLQAFGGACRKFAAAFGKHERIDPPTAVASCSAPSVPSLAEVTRADKSLCVPTPSACAGQACTTKGLAACLVKAGDVPCPKSAPKKHLVGADVTLNCPACTCQIDATCSGTMTFYAKDDCTDQVKELPTGTCTGTANESFASTKWTGTVATTNCNALSVGTPSVGLENEQTVCCP